MRNKAELKDFLEKKYRQYNTPDFIATDPVSIPLLFTGKQDIEIAGFLAATIAWGQRPTILRNAQWLLRHMDFDPHAYLLHASEKELKQFESFVHRTFNGTDCRFFMKALRKIYLHFDSLEDLFLVQDDPTETDYSNNIVRWRKYFFKTDHEQRTEKHFADPSAGSAAKRINMFLRWMVRKDNCGVDPGIWKKTDPARLICPLDVHSGRVARKLGLLKRNANDWKAAAELTDELRKMDPADPVKYDFALFGLGVFERF